MNNDLFFYAPSGHPLLIKYPRVILVRKNESVTECYLSCQVSKEIHQYIHEQKLFHFEPNLGVGATQLFLAAYSSEIKFLLNPDLLSIFETYFTSDEQAIVYLQQLHQKDTSHPLISTESWILLSAQEQQPQGVVQYRTVWDYLDWGTIAADNSQAEIDDLLIGALANFLKDTTLRHLAHDTANGEVNPQLVEASTQLIETLFTVAPSLFSDDKAAKASFVNAIADVFTQSLRSQLTEYLENALAEDTVELPNQQLSETAIAPQPTSVNTIFETAVRFFQAENWIVNQLSDQPILHLNFAGENGQWECYAQAREIQQQFIFYSLLPVKVPEPKRQAIAEYITRANYGITIGNFELDFNDGEIRYKTSISVEGSQLDLPLVKQLVYSNLLNVDKYLSGFLQVISGELSPSEAIAQIEV